MEPVILHPCCSTRKFQALKCFNSYNIMNDEKSGGIRLKPFFGLTWKATWHINKALLGKCQFRFKIWLKHTAPLNMKPVK